MAITETQERPKTVLFNPAQPSDEFFYKNPAVYGHVSRVTIVDNRGETQLRISERKAGEKYHPNAALRIRAFLTSADRRLMTVVWETVNEDIRTHSFDPRKTSIFLKVKQDPQDQLSH